MLAEPWPEHPLPPNLASEINCRGFGMTGHGRFVWGEGEPNSPFLLVLDNPGAREDKQGAPLVCGTRRTLRRALDEAGFDAARVFITYVVKCRPLRTYDKAYARRFGAAVLSRQVAALRPQILILFGDVVVQTLVGDDASVRALRGRPLSVFETRAWVSYHPLAARRRPNLYPLLVDDLSQARVGRFD